MRAKIFRSGNSLALRLPAELRPEVGEVEIEAVGGRWVVTPKPVAPWPRGFFEKIRLDEPEQFVRPAQGSHRKVEL